MLHSMHPVQDKTLWQLYTVGHLSDLCMAITRIWIKRWLRWHHKTTINHLPSDDLMCPGPSPTEFTSATPPDSHRSSEGSHPGWRSQHSSGYHLAPGWKIHLLFVDSWVLPFKYTKNCNFGVSTKSLHVFVCVVCMYIYIYTYITNITHICL